MPEDNGASPTAGIDRIGALPDDLLHHLLSFLPAQAAVRTCVLARRWRHLWRSTTGLRIVGIEDAVPVKDLRKFVDHLLIPRERTDLDTVEIKFGECLEEEVPYVNLWTRFALQCKVRALTLHLSDENIYRLHLDLLPFVSRHLRTLDLSGVVLQGTFLDFSSSCPALEDLKINECDIGVGKISSRSLKHLSMSSCHFDRDCRARISAPCLVSLILYNYSGKTPLLESMPLLETALISLADSDVCYDCAAGFLCCPDCASGDRMLVSAISDAKHLELLSYCGMCIFQRDLTWRPRFSQLKVLLLNEWCVTADPSALDYFLQHSPILEKLTLQICKLGRSDITGGRYKPRDESFKPKNLKIVEVQCDRVDDTRVCKVLDILSAHGIPREQITFQHIDFYFGTFSLQTRRV